MKSISSLILIVSSVLSVNQVLAEQTFSSGDKPVSVVELYTSEGCSSCPPADKWLSKLQNHKGLWTDFIPMAFHVDYWDYIGWKDPYASRANSQRQRRYAAEYRERTVYTPGIRRNGKEWREWRYGADLVQSNLESVGVLSLQMQDDYSFEAEFSSEQAQTMQLNIAVLGMGLSQDVTRGENQGRTLEHDFVVLGTSSFASADQGKWSGQLPKPKADADRYAVVAWVSEAGRQSPVQATGGLLANN